jgi:transcriptional regulator with XRE-family HTH domain
VKNLTKRNYKIALLQLGISQRKVADILGYSEQYISMILSGKRSCKKFDEWMYINAPHLFKRGARLR